MARRHLTVLLVLEPSKQCGAVSGAGTYRCIISCIPSNSCWLACSTAIPPDSTVLLLQVYMPYGDHRAIWTCWSCS